MAVKKKKINLLIISLAVICVIAGAAFFALKYYISKFSDPAFISSFLSEKTGCPVSVRKVSIISTSQLFVEGLRVNTPKNVKNSGEILSCEKTFVFFDIWELLKTRDIQSIGKIELAEPKLTMTGDYVNWLKTLFEKKTEVPEHLPIIIVQSGSAKFTAMNFSVPVKNIEGQITPLKNGIKFNFNGSAGEFGAPWHTEGVVPREGNKIIKIDIIKMDLSALCKLVNIPVPATGFAALNIEGSGTDKLVWTGSAQSDKAVLWKVEVSGIKSLLTYKDGVIDFSDLSGTLLGGGFKAKASITPEGKDFTARVSGTFNGLSFEASEKIFPELAGVSGKTRGSLNIAKDGKDLNISMQAASDNLSVDGKKIPPVSAAMKLGGDTITFNPLRFSNKDIALELTGQLFLKQKRVKLKGSFKGDSVEKLNALLNGFLPGLKANLTGDFTIEGDIANPQITYNGKISGLIYDDKLIGDGLINIAIDKNGALKGRFDLDKPVEYTNKSPKVSVKLRLYFDISGTVKKPVLTPVPSEAKIDIDQSQIWDIFQKIINEQK